MLNRFWTKFESFIFTRDIYISLNRYLKDLKFASFLACLLKNSYLKFALVIKMSSFHSKFSSLPHLSQFYDTKKHILKFTKNKKFEPTVNSSSRQWFFLLQEKFVNFSFFKTSTLPVHFPKCFPFQIKTFRGGPKNFYPKNSYII